MWHRFYKFLAPKSVIDLCAKVIFFCVLINVMNFAFNMWYPDAPSLPFQYIFLNGLLVGGPFVLLFFLVLIKQVKLQKSMVRLARYDDLTNLPNRRHFLKQTAMAIAEDEFAVLLIMDVDHFKRVNDTWGHTVGDACLRNIGHILARSIRSDDLVGRLGGEEFGILLRDTRLDRISYIVTKLLQPLPFNAGGKLEHLSVTLSIGACEIARGGDLDAAMIIADKALYRAKDNGRARMELAA